VNKLERTAYHEAGHIAVAFAFGVRVTGATVQPDGNGQARFLSTMFHRRTLEHVRRDLALTLAGYIAAEMASGRDWRDLSLRELLRKEAAGGTETTGVDYHLAVASLLEEVGADPDTAADAAALWLRDELPTAAARAASILERSWAELAAFAHCLVNERHVEFATAEATIEAVAA
jgi:hypothetical protein